MLHLAQLQPQVARRMEAGEILAAEIPHRLVTRARASPTASMAVVLPLGARPSGQASCTGPMAMATRGRPTQRAVGAGGDRHDRHP